MNLYGETQSSAQTWYCAEQPSRGEAAVSCLLCVRGRRTHPGVSPQRTGVFFIRLLNSTTSSMTSGEVSLVETISTWFARRTQQSGQRWPRAHSRAGIP